MSLQDKHLKYKNKYLVLKNQLGGSGGGGGGGSSGGGDPVSMGGAAQPSSGGGNPNPQSQIQIDFREYIENNNIEGVKRILAIPGFNVNLLNSNKSLTFLGLALFSNLEIFKAILDRSDVNITFNNQDMSLTVLTVLLKGFGANSLITNPIEKLILLVNKEGLNINQQDLTHRFTPLMDLVETITSIKDTTSDDYHTGITMLIILLKFCPTIDKSLKNKNGMTVFDGPLTTEVKKLLL
jgi:hypothetical protein